MIPRSPGVAVGCLALAALLHGVAFWDSASDSSTWLAGGTIVQEAALGSSFADMVAGQSPASTPKTITVPVQTESIPPRKTVQQALAPNPATPRQAVNTQQPATSVPAVEPLTPSTVRTADTLLSDVQAALQAQPTPQIRPDQTTTPRRAVQAPKPVQTIQAPTIPRSSTAPLQAPQTQSLQTDPLQMQSPTPPTATAVSPPSPPAPPQPNPVAQPDASSKTASVAVPRLRPATLVPAGQKPPAQNAPVKEPARQLKPPTAAGNATATAAKGRNAGTQTATVAQTTRATSTNSAAGTDTLTNYKGQVFRKIQRSRRDTVNIKGTVLLTMAISPSGRLSSVHVARSSGSAKLDRVAIAQIKRAAPFPAPPQGRALMFSIQVNGKR